MSFRNGRLRQIAKSGNFKQVFRLVLAWIWQSKPAAKEGKEL
jgi:hypothetical protein